MTVINIKILKIKNIFTLSIVAKWLILIGVTLTMGCAHNNLNATLWMQQSAEYRGNTVSIYNSAKHQLLKLMEIDGITSSIRQAEMYSCHIGEECNALSMKHLKPAVILDLDETVFDNSAYQARLIKNDDSYSSDTWDDWVLEKNARVVPGALSFIEYLHANNVTVIYITNRKCLKRDIQSDDACPQKKDTLDNLKKLGFPAVESPNHLILRNERAGWESSDKTSRRMHVAEQYQIIMLIGDALGDFAPNTDTLPIKNRNEYIEKYRSAWGTIWYLLPNPSYGYWMKEMSKKPENYLKYQ